jgi:putative DNA primase/helicase
VNSASNGQATSTPRAPANQPQSQFRSIIQSARPIGAPDLGMGKALPRVNPSINNLVYLTTAALENLRSANNPPYILRFAGLLAWLEPDEKGKPFPRILTESHLRHELARTMEWGDWKSDGKDQEKWVSQFPPMDVVRDILATPDLPFPPLEAVVEIPIFGRDGSLQLTPGYHAASRTFYVPGPTFRIGQIPKRPSQAEVTQARSLLVDDLLGDFPFVSTADCAHAVAFSLLLYARHMISGPTPLHVFEKPAAGTGATLMVNLLVSIAIGRPLPAMSEASNEEEIRKRITAVLRKAPQVVLIDNVRQGLYSGALAAAITSDFWEDRLLGSNVTVCLPVGCAWMCTANNVSMSDEIARRVIRSRLDAHVERPWLRQGFRHPNIKDWVAERRAELVRANLVLIQAWIAEGRPLGKQELGMFESWAQVIGGVLEVAGVSGFLGNVMDFYEGSDPESEAFREFAQEWFNQFEMQLIGVDGLLPIAQRHLDLGAGTPQAQKIRLGKLLAQNRDRLFGPLRLERGEKYQGSNRYRLVSTKP